MRPSAAGADLRIGRCAGALLSYALQQLLNSATIVDMPEPDGETRHFHAWFRIGRVFTMQTRVFSDRTAAHRWAAKQRPVKEDRIILACTKCPVSRKSRRRAIRWGHVAKALGVALPALRAAIETERRRE